MAQLELDQISFSFATNPGIYFVFFKQGQTQREREWELSKPTCYFCTGKTWLSFSLEKIVKQSSKENRKRKQIILVTTKHKKIRSFLYILAFFRKKRFEINFLFLRNASKFAIYIVYLINALVYLDIDQGIHKVKLKVAWTEKWKKNYLGFLFL